MNSTWRKSTYSGDTGGACVEAATADLVLVRDTTDRDGGLLTFSGLAWSRFVEGL